MVLLTIFKNKAEGKSRRISKTYESIDEAVKAGQNSGSFYDIYDLASQRSIDWEEIYERDDNDDDVVGWYYDEVDYTWKKVQEESIEEWLVREFRWLFFDDDHNPLPEQPYDVLFHA